jgi:hypothetical protein
MELFKKITKARLEISKLKITKSGKNTFAKYDYYELSDFLPHVLEQQEKLNLFSVVRFSESYATLTIYDCEKEGDFIEFNSPMSGLEVKGANTIQNIGAMQTYQRRYLYMLAYEISENDAIDKVAKEDIKDPEKPALTPKSEKWKNAVDYFAKNKNFTLMEKHYFISDENKELIKKEVENA